MRPNLLAMLTSIVRANRTGGAALVALVVVAACGTSPSDEASSTPSAVGGDLVEAGPTTSEPSASPTTTTSEAVAAAPPIPDAGTAGPANRTVLDHESGWRLTFTVADRLEFGRTDDITFELVFENLSDRTLHVDANQDLRFAIAAEGAGQTEAAWTTRSCHARSAQPPPPAAVPYGAGERGVYVDTYPVEQAARAGGGDADACRVPPGDYLVVGQLDWCPPEALEEVRYQDKVDHVCRDGGVETLVSAPLRITIR